MSSTTARRSEAAPPPASAAPSGWRRRLKRFALAALIGAALLALAFLCLPLPIGWAVNLAARLALPPEPGLGARVESATFRWQLGRDTARVEFTGLRAEVKQAPLAAIRGITIEIDKGAAWRGFYAPRLVVVSAPHVTVDTRSAGAFSLLQSAAGPAGAGAPPAPAAAAPTASLAVFAPFLPAPGGEARLRIDELRVDYVFTGLKWSVLGRIDTNVSRQGDDVRARTTAHLGTGERPIAGTLEFDASLATGRVAARVSLPELRTTDLPALPGGDLPFTGTLALATRFEGDYATRALLAAEVDFSLRDGALKLATLPGPPVALERLAIRGRAERRGGELWAELERGELLVEGARLEVRKLAASLVPRARVTWEAALADVAGARLGLRLPDTLRAALPWAAGLLEQSALARLDSRGTAIVVRNRDGALVCDEVEAVQRLAVHIAGEALGAELVARQQPGAPIEIEARLDPFEPAKLAPAFPREWPIAAAAFPLRAELSARASAAGELLAAQARLTLGAGELRAVAPVPLAVPIRGLVATVRIHDRGARLEVPALTLDTALGRLELTDLAARREGPAAAVSGRVVAAGFAAAAFEGLVPADARERLRALGLALGDFALPRAVIDFNAGLTDRPGTGWQPSRADVAAELEFAFAGRPIVVRATAQLPEHAAEATVRITGPEIRPADFAPRQIAGVELGDFDFPIHLAATARAAVSPPKLRSAAVRLRAGPGVARVAALNASLPFRVAQVDGEFDVENDVVTVSAARLQLAPGVEAGVEQVRVALSPALHVTGVAKLAPLALRDAVAWWPEKLRPDLRAHAAAVLGGALETAGIEFELAPPTPGAGLAPRRAQGTIALRALSARLPGTPAPVEVDEARVLLDFPRAEVRVRGLRTPGLVVQAASGRVGDVMARRLTAAASATFIVEPAAAKPWLAALPPSPALVSAQAATGSLRGELNATGPIDPEDFAGAKLALGLSAERLTVPGIFDGPLETSFEFTAPTRTTWVVEGKLAASGAKLLALDEHPSLGPVSLALTLRDWLTSERPGAELTLHAADLGGRPLRLHAAAELVPCDGTVARADVKRFAFGRTELTAAWRREAERDTLAVTADRIDVAELAAAASPWLGAFDDGPPPPPAPPAPSARATTATTSAATSAGPPPPLPPPPARAKSRPLDVAFAAGEIVFGKDRHLSRVAAEAAIDDGWPRTARLAATEGGRNLVSFELAPHGERQRVKFAAVDVAALAQTLTEPLRATKLPPGRLAALAQSIGPVPMLIAGGTVGLEGELTRDAARDHALSARGNFLLTEATMIRAPRVLQMLALRSGRKLEQSPLIRKLSVGEWSFDPEHVAIKAFAVEGSGLIDRVKLNAARYAFGTEKIFIDGEYFGVGFEVIGTRGDPQVFLKENAFIRAIGQRNEFDVFFEEPAPKTPPQPK